MLRSRYSRAFLPRWFYFFGTEKLKRMARFGFLIHNMIEERAKQLRKLRRSSTNKDEFAESIKNVLGRLVNSREVEGKNSLSEQEIVVNCFIFVSSCMLILMLYEKANAHLLSGVRWAWQDYIHDFSFMSLTLLSETTETTLAVTLALLALYQDEQEWGYQSIKNILGDREPASLLRAPLNFYSRV